MASIKKTKWVVTTSSKRPLADVARDLTAAGFEIDQTMDQMGVFTGKSEKKAVEKLRRVPGVTDVSPEPPPADVGPPGSDDTW